MNSRSADFWNLAVSSVSISKQAYFIITAAIVVLIAIATRFYGLSWDQGYNYTPHPDERFILSKVAELRMPPIGDLGQLFDAETSSWNPKRFAYGSLPLYLLKIVELGYEFATNDRLHDLRLTGRILSSIADVSTVVFLFFVGSMAYGRRVGLMASALAAISVIHIQLSHFFAVDTLLTAFIVGCLFFLMRFARQGWTWDSIAAGAFLGFGLATKISVAPILGVFFLAHAMFVFSLLGPDQRSFNTRLAKGLIGVGTGLATTILVLFIVQPYMFLDWSRFYQDVSEQSEMVRRIRDYPYTRQYIDTIPYWYQVKQLSIWGLGWPLGVISWFGLIAISIRGMRLGHGATYLISGWLIPALLLLYSNSFAMTVVALFIALASLTASLFVRRPDTRTDVLLLAWVVPYFLIIGSFEVKFMRYLLPITPFLILFGAQSTLSIWANMLKQHPVIKGSVVLFFLAGIAATLFYSVAFTSMYGEKHTAVKASEWIRSNVPADTSILKEHWEEALPNLHAYEFDELEIYNPDNSQKTYSMASKLASAEYLVFYSNRLYGTISRLPERYPVTSGYYDLIFSGQLGYEVANFATNYPEFLGISFVDDTFSRSEIAAPDQLSKFRQSRWSLQMGFADESFSVYDHPKVIVLRNVGHYSSDAITKIIESKRGYISDTPIISEPTGLMISEDDLKSYRMGGTWTDIVINDSWISKSPMLSWLLVIEFLALSFLPIALWVFRALPDRGFLFSKVLGLMFVGLGVWLLSSLKLIEFSRFGIFLSLFIMLGLSSVVAVVKFQDLSKYFRTKWKLILISEFVFLAAYFLFVFIRMVNPDLWHPYRGGEKPMDLAYLNAILRSTFMPPYDPWFSGGYINYYYWGQFLVAMVIRVTGIQPVIAFNLAVATFFAFTVGGAFSLVYNLAESTRINLTTSTSLAKAAFDKAKHQINFMSVVAGFTGVAFVAILGNLDGFFQLIETNWKAAYNAEPFWDQLIAGFDFWRSSRMMAPDPPGFEITEFPFFTFIFADLHAHMIAIPVTLVTLGASFTVLLASQGLRERGLNWSWNQIILIVLLGFVVGSLRVINAWDFPTYLVIAIATIFVAEYFVHGGLGLTVIFRWLAKSLLMLLVGYIAFLPYHLKYESFFNSLQLTTNTTGIWQFLSINGLFVFIIASFFIVEFWKTVSTNCRKTSRLRFAFRESVLEINLSSSVNGSTILGIVMIVGACTLLLIYNDILGTTVPYVVLFLAATLLVAIKWVLSQRPDVLVLAFVAILVVTALSLVFGLDVFRVAGDIDRMNSVFKFYLQIWVLMAVASAYILWRMFYFNLLLSVRKFWVGRAWLAACVMLVMGTAIYPILGTHDRISDRFDDSDTLFTLDGTAYIKGSVYRDPKGIIDIESDFEGIEWLLENVEGSPVILEGLTDSYRWGGRVSVYTGLPSVIGWKWHQEQQRWGYQAEVDYRIRDVNQIYNTINEDSALGLIKKYEIEYIYVGPLEKVYYSSESLGKFDRMSGSTLDIVFRSDNVIIYRVRG
tara:strand:+ start:4715 stop:9253 length:4539 start_codon:yes stop_codon:yes gene_type:complete